MKEWLDGWTAGWLAGWMDGWIIDNSFYQFSVFRV
jgi:hypothetical protein